jgi:hypothetical protein
MIGGWGATPMKTIALSISEESAKRTFPPVLNKITRAALVDKRISETLKIIVPTFDPETYCQGTSAILSHQLPSR